jgi:tripartite-type tricarboxylate transporter receptor subunit TctC
MAGELFYVMAGVNMVHIPYRGQGPALTDLLGGNVQVSFATSPGIVGYIKAGKLRALAVTTASGAEVLRDLPTVGNFVPGYEASQWYGICAPKGTPDAIIDTLSNEINAAFADARMKARFADIGGEPLTSSPREFGKLIADETEKWAKVVKFAGLMPQ